MIFLATCAAYVASNERGLGEVLGGILSSGNSNPSGQGYLGGLGGALPINLGGNSGGSPGLIGGLGGGLGGLGGGLPIIGGNSGGSPGLIGTTSLIGGATSILGGTSTVVGGLGRKR